jgi:hypothetical protein
MIYLLKSLFNDECHKVMNMNDEIGRAYFKVRSQNSSGGTMLWTSVQRLYGTLRAEMCRHSDQLVASIFSVEDSKNMRL